MKRKKNRKPSRGPVAAMLITAACLGLGATSTPSSSAPASQADVQKVRGGKPLSPGTCPAWGCGSNHNEVLLGS